MIDSNGSRRGPRRDRTSTEWATVQQSCENQHCTTRSWRCGAPCARNNRHAHSLAGQSAASGLPSGGTPPPGHLPVTPSQLCCALAPVRVVELEPRRGRAVRRQRTGCASVEDAERSLTTTATCRAPPKVRPWPGRSTPTHCTGSQSRALRAKNENVYADGCCAQNWLITEWRDWVVMAEQH
jgi:hypothetical protein